MTLQKNCVLMLAVLLYLFCVLVTVNIVSSEKLKGNELLQYLVIFVLAAIFGVAMYLVYDNSELKKENYHKPEHEESHNNKHSKNELSNKLKDNQIVLVVAMWCGFSKRQLAHLEESGLKEHVKILDEAKDKDQMKEMNIKPRAFPHWHSMTTGRGESGYTEDIGKVVDDLSQAMPEKSHSGGDQSDPLKRLKDLNLVMIYADWCGHCNSTKKMFKQSGVVNGDHIELLTSDEAQKKYGVTVEALPCFYKHDTKEKQLGGVGSVEQLIEKFE